MKGLSLSLLATLVTSKKLFSALLNILLVTGLILFSGNFTRTSRQTQITRTEIQVKPAETKAPNYNLACAPLTVEIRETFQEKLFNIRLIHFERMITCKRSHINEIFADFTHDLQFYTIGFHTKMIECHPGNFCG